MTSPTSSAVTPPPGRWGVFARVAVVVVVVAALLAATRYAGGYVPRFAHWVETQGAWGPLTFIAGYAIAVVGFVPASALTLAAGAIFGLVRGTAYVFVAATIGACLSFQVSRHLARATIERRLQGDERFAAIDRAITEQGRRIVFLLRLSPVFPFNVLNYALGLTNVRFVDYAVACIGMLPGTLLYVYLGHVGGGIVGAAAGAMPEHEPGVYALQAVGLVATIAVTVVVTRTARRALEQATNAGLTR